MTITALQIKHGSRAGLPAKAAMGEPLISLDTGELFFGRGTATGDLGVFKLSDVIFADVAPAVFQGKLWIDTVNNAIYRASDAGDSWVACTASQGSDAISTDLQVYGVSQGVYTDGNVIPAGTSLETIIKNMLQAVIPPTYQAPTLSLAYTGQLAVEAGTQLVPTITPTFLQRDGGAPILYTLNRNGVTVLTDPAAQAFLEPGITIGDNTVVYQATESYNEGPIKNDNQGNPSPTGRISAGTAVSAAVTFLGKRNAFYAFDDATVAPADSASVRALTGKLLGPVVGTVIGLNIPAGTKRVVIAYPDTLRDISSIKYVELGNGEVKDTFVKTAVQVQGANGFADIGYKVFTYTPAVPFGDNVTYNVTI